MKKRTQKILMLFMVLAMIFALCACTAPAVQVQNADGSLTLAGVIIEQTVNLAFKAIEAAVMIFSVWALEKLGKNKNMQSLSIAIQLVCDMAIQTAGELQQTVVERLKAENEDGKLTPADINDLKYRLFNMTKAKLSDAVKEIIIASGADLDAIITGACENQINAWKKSLEFGDFLTVPAELEESPVE